MHSPSVRRTAPHTTFLSRLLPLSLAVAATGTSAWISIVAGLERGGTSAERFAWAAVAVVVLLAAHLLPALTRGEPLQVKLPAITLWLACLVGTGYGHATFFLAAQQHAGAQRAAAVDQGNALEHVAATGGRPRDVIARDQARVTQQLATARAERCKMACASLGVRRETLAAQLAALAIEAQIAERRERATDRAEAERQAVRARQDQARTDPVTSRAARLLGLSRDTVDLTLALLFGLLLECVACVGWLQALPSRICDSGVRGDPEKITVDRFSDTSHQPLVGPHREEVPVAPDEFMSTTSVATEDPVSAATQQLVQFSFDSEALRLANAIAAGQVRFTVADIRRYLRCSQTKAAEMRRRVLSMTESAPATVMDAEPVSPPHPRPTLVHATPIRVA